jgi:hypothetical protein
MSFIPPSSINTSNAVRETRELAVYLAGLAQGSQDPSIKRAADWLDKLSRQICAQGYVGCRGGERCTSDHK